MSTSRASLRRRGLQLVWLTIAWNVVEVFVTIGLGVAAGSIALIAFGTDSMIEVFASLVVVWHTSDLNAEIRRTRRSLQLIAAAFLILGLVLVVGAVVRLLAGTVPGDSPVGIAYLAVTAVVMLRLAILKRRTGTALESEPLLAEAHVTFLDSALAVGVLAALALNSAFGWWWADPMAALAVALLAFLEAREHWSDARRTTSDQ
ncbi:MAG: cation transporter [Acidimicrobiia bacterium]|jgi:divalent metal cation (Fe/Co/Zn/Cd) transporter